MTSEKLDIKKQEELQIISKLRLLDDDLMKLVFDRNIEATELLLNIILQRADIKVLEVVTEREYKNPLADGRSIVIDIYAKDSDEKIYDIEVQRSDRGADFRRARFYSSMIDTKMLKEKQDFKDIHDSYVIFITENDVIGDGLSLYHIGRMVKETGATFVDGSYIIYVNGSYRDDNDPIGKLMHDFRCTNPDEMFYSLLAKQVRYFKETEGGRSDMCKAVEEFAKKWGEEIAEEIAEERAREMMKERGEDMAKRMIVDGELSTEKIAEYTGLSIDEVEELAKDNGIRIETID